MFQETVDFVGSKLKQKGCNACPDMQRFVFAIVAIALRNGANSRKISRVKDEPNTRIVEGEVRQI